MFCPAFLFRISNFKLTIFSMYCCSIRIKGLDNEDKFKMVFPTVSMIRVDEDETTRPMYVAALQRLERRRHFSEDRLDASVSDDSFGSYEYFDSLDFIPGQSFRDPDREIRPKINWRYILGYILMIHVLTRVLVILLVFLCYFK